MVMDFPVSTLKSMRCPAPAKRNSMPLCCSPSRSMRAPTPDSRKISTVPCSSTPARTRLSIWSRVRLSRTTDSIPCRPHRPDALLKPFHRQGLSAQQPVLHGKAALSPLRHAGFHADDISERRRGEKSRARLHQRNARNLKSPHHFRHREAQRAVEERIGASVEIFKIAREKHNSEGVAVAPFDLDFLAIHEHGVVPPSAPDSAPGESNARPRKKHRIWSTGVCLR